MHVELVAVASALAELAHASIGSFLTAWYNNRLATDALKLVIVSSLALNFYGRVL